MAQKIAFILKGGYLGLQVCSFMETPCLADHRFLWKMEKWGRGEILTVSPHPPLTVNCSPIHMNRPHTEIGITN